MEFFKKDTNAVDDAKIIAIFIAEKGKPHSKKYDSPSKNQPVFEKIVLSTLLLLKIDKNKDICQTKYNTGLTSITENFENRLYTYIKSLELTISIQVYYNLILKSTLEDLTQKCSYNEKEPFKKIKEDKILELEIMLWNQIGYNNSEKIKSFKNSVLKEFELLPEIKILDENKKFNNDVYYNFGRAQHRDDKFFTDLHTVIPDISVENDLEEFLKKEDFYLANKPEFDEHMRLFNRSVKYLQNFVSTFKNTYNLTPFDSSINIIRQIKNLINQYDDKHNNLKAEPNVPKLTVTVNNLKAEPNVPKSTVTVNNLKAEPNVPKLTDAAGLTKITDNDFKEYWLEKSKDNPDNTKITQLSKPEYKDLENYVLEKFYGIIDKSKQVQLTNTFTSFVFLCHMLEFMHANPPELGTRTYIDIYKNLQIFNTGEKIETTEIDESTVKSVFFRYLRLSLMGGLDEKVKNLINETLQVP
jgi:hypothetical protein